LDCCCFGGGWGVGDGEEVGCPVGEEGGVEV